MGFAESHVLLRRSFQQSCRQNRKIVFDVDAIVVAENGLVQHDAHRAFAGFVDDADDVLRIDDAGCIVGRRYFDKHGHSCFVLHFVGVIPRDSAASESLARVCTPNLVFNRLHWCSTVLGLR